MPGAVDTLQIYERLRLTDLNDKTAKEIAEVFKEITEEHLATKKDFDTAVERAKVEMIKWVAGMLVAQAAIVATLVKLLKLCTFAFQETTSFTPPETHFLFLKQIFFRIDYFFAFFGLYMEFLGRTVL